MTIERLLLVGALLSGASGCCFGGGGGAEPGTYSGSASVSYQTSEAARIGLSPVSGASHQASLTVAPAAEGYAITLSVPSLEFSCTGSGAGSASSARPGMTEIRVASAQCTYARAPGCTMSGELVAQVAESGGNDAYVSLMGAVPADPSASACSGGWVSASIEPAPFGGLLRP